MPTTISSRSTEPNESRSVITDPTSGQSLRVLDVHHHLGLTEGVADGLPFANRLAIMDRSGIDQAVLMPANAPGATASARMQAVNDRVATMVEAHTDRFPAGVARLDLAEGLAATRQELARATDELRLRGVGWHHRFQGSFLDHPDMVPLLRDCAWRGVPAFVHVVEGSTLEAPWRLAALLDAAPETTVIALDAFSSWDRAGELTQLAVRYPNLHCELGALSAVAGHLVLEFARKVGSGRLILGTDLFMHEGQSMTYQVPFAVLEVVHLDLLPAEKEAVLSGNASRLLRLA